LKGMLAVITGAIAFYVVNLVASTLITGTDTASTVFQSLVPLAVALGVAVKAFMSMGDKNE
jgi:hypothetical protein